MKIYLESAIVILVVTISVSESLFCGENERFSICGNNECRPTCKLPRGPQFCDPKCRPGCICVKGLVRREADKKCVKLEKCYNSRSPGNFLRSPGCPPQKKHLRSPGCPPQIKHLRSPGCPPKIKHLRSPGCPPQKKHLRSPGCPPKKKQIPQKCPHIQQGPQSKRRRSPQGQGRIQILDHLPGNAFEAESNDTDKTELEKKLRKEYEKALNKVKELIEKGKGLKEDAVKKLKEVRDKMKENNIEIEKKAKNLFDKIKKKAKEAEKKILDKIYGDDDEEGTTSTTDSTTDSTPSTTESTTDSTTSSSL